MSEINRQQFFEDFAEVMKKHDMKNALIVYVGHGQVFNTTFNAEDNDVAKVLNNMSDVIDNYFNQNP